MDAYNTDNIKDMKYVFLLIFVSLCLNCFVLDMVNFVQSSRFEFINLSCVPLERLSCVNYKLGRALHTVTNNKTSNVPAKCISVGMVGIVHMSQPYQVGKEGFAKVRQHLGIQLLKT